MTTIRDFLEEVAAIGSTIIGNSTMSAKVPEFIRNNDFMETLTAYIDLNHGDLLLNKRNAVWVDGGQVDGTQRYVSTVLVANAYMLEGLWDTTQYEYEPTENYHMWEKGEEKNTGTDTTTYNKGEQQDGDGYGNRKSKTIQQQANDTMIYGNQTETTEHSVSPFEKTGYTAQNKDVTAAGNHTDQSQIGAREVDYEEEARNDTHTSGSRKDTTDVKHGHNVGHDLERWGNIGVTTTQQMIQSQRDVVKLNLFKIISDLIISQICILVD